MPDIFGNVNPPPGINIYGNVTDGAGGLTLFIGNILKTLIFAAGVYALFNVVLAGYAFMSAGDDPKKIAGAWAKIWQSLLGLLVAAGSFVIMGIISRLLFGNFFYIFGLKIFGPN
jgi:hypothetical protein